MERQSGALGVTVARGWAGTGKTAFVVRRVVRLLADGAAPEEVLVVAASPDAAVGLRARLAAEGATDVAVVTTRQIALEVLRRSAGAGVRRCPRVMLPFERLFLMEDLKVTGLRPRRLKEMLKFVLRGWSDLRGDDPAWLINDQERNFEAFLLACLEDYGCYLEEELPVAALSRINGNDAPSANWYGFSHVLVDDFTSLSVASQALAEALAGASLTVTGDDGLRAPVFEPYPFPGGLNELERRFPNAVRVDLNESRCATDVIASLRAIEGSPRYPSVETAPAGGESRQGLSLERNDSPEAEAAMVVRCLEEQRKGGQELRDLCVAVPLKKRGRSLARALVKAGIPVAARYDGSRLGGDVRVLDRCLTARAFALLQLCADSQDPAAVRSWCGFGDHLARSALFDELRLRAQKEGASWMEILSCEDRTDSVAAMDDLVEARALLRKGTAFASDAAALRGRVLIEAAANFVVGDAGIPADDRPAAAAFIARTLEEECGPVEPSDDATVLTARAYGHAALPTFEADAGVRICPYEQAWALDASCVIATGFVDGLIPPKEYFDRTQVTADQQAALNRRSLERLQALLSAMRGEGVVSVFDAVALEDPLATDVRVARISVKEGRRRGRVEPSRYLRYLAFDDRVREGSS